MNSTIHDLYFSDTNFNYIYNLITKLILNETKFNISQNDKYLTIYKSNYPKYFNNNDTDDISYLNKLLIDDIGGIILEDIKSSYSINTDTINTINTINTDTINTDTINDANKISYNIIKFKSVLIDNIEHICVQTNDNKIKVDNHVDFFENNKYLNTLICNKVMDNYIFFLAKGFNSKSNKIIS